MDRRSHEQIVTIVLAAGSSRRMGTPKQLLAWGDEVVLGRVLSQLPLTTQTLIITGAHADRVAAIAAAHTLTTVHNPDHAHSEMIGSLQCGLRSLAAWPDALFVVMADQPMITTDTYNTILAAWRGNADDIIAPIFQGKRGNPVLLGRAHFPQLLTLPATAAPRHILRAHPNHLRLIEVADDTILRDLDTPEQYAFEQSIYRRGAPIGRPKKESS